MQRFYSPVQGPRSELIKMKHSRREKTIPLHKETIPNPNPLTPTFPFLLSSSFFLLTTYISHISHTKHARDYQQISKSPTSQILNAKCNILAHLRGMPFDSGRDKSHNSICNFCPVFSEYGIQNERQISCTCANPLSGSHQHVIVFCVVDI